MSYLCAQRPEFHESVTPLVATPVAPLAGRLYAGVSGGSGTNGFVSWFPVALVHLRLNCAWSQLKIQGCVVNMLCSRCESLDGDVQFDDPKMVMPLPRSRMPFSWSIPWWPSRRTWTPALYILSTLYASQSRSGLRYSCSSVISRTGRPRPSAEIIALV